MKTPSSEYSREDLHPESEYSSAFTQFLDTLSSIITESIHVLDVQHGRFCYICPNDLILCGFSTKDALKDRDGFLKKIVYPTDYTLCMEMRKAILQYLKTSKGKRDEIDHFSCTLRLRRKYTSLDNPLSQMIFLRIKPYRENGEWRYLICTAGSSTSKEAGRLYMFHTNGSVYDAYNFNSGHWKQNIIEPLTECEKAVLILAGQGYTINEIAGNLCKGYYTVCNQIKLIYSKLKVNTMQEAIDLSNHYHMIYAEVQDVKLQSAETADKKNRSSLADESFQRIQQYLDDGKSIRQTARQEGIAEGTVRYWIKQGKLKKQTLARVK
jgi:DNA-binding NarL/FixJ family response regulator